MYKYTHRYIHYLVYFKTKYKKVFEYAKATESNNEKLKKICRALSEENKDYIKDELKGTWIRPTSKNIQDIQKTLDKIEEQHIEISEKMTDLQTEIAEVEKLMNDADLKDLKEKTAGVEAEIKRYEKNMADANNEIEGLHQRIDFINKFMFTILIA